MGRYIWLDIGRSVHVLVVMLIVGRLGGTVVQWGLFFLGVGGRAGTRLQGLQAPNSCALLLHRAIASSESIQTRHPACLSPTKKTPSRPGPKKGTHLETIRPPASCLHGRTLSGNTYRSMQNYATSSAKGHR